MIFFSFLSYSFLFFDIVFSYCYFLRWPFLCRCFGGGGKQLMAAEGRLGDEATNLHTGPDL